MAEFQAGDEFAGHRIVSLAGRGGMGVVYRAVQLDLDRPVALKLIAADLAQDDGFRDRFVRESRAAAAIDHPNVVPIYYTGEQAGQLYIAMRWVQGSDLRTLVRASERLEPGRAASIVAQVAGALDAAHEQGILHRDVKPANVLLGAGDHAYLSDFGLTKRLNSHTGSTHAGGWVGTLGYVAPEQIRGERVDARADVYALGCVLFLALAGEPPYQRDSDEATLWAHLHDPPPGLRERAPAAPEAFEAVVARALAKDPDDRYPSAGDLGRAAVAAAGRGAPTTPERLVATGAAAPEADAETVASPDQAATRPVDGAPRTAVAGAHGARRWAWALALLPIAALAVLAAILLGGGGGDGTTTAPQAGTAPEPVPGGAGTLVRTIDVGGRPNDVVEVGDLVWVLRAGSERAATISPRSGRRTRVRPRVGALPASAAAGFGKLWVVNQSGPALVAIGLGSRRRTGGAVALPAQGKAVAVATGERGVWVGIRGNPGLILRVDPRRRTIARTIPMPAGVHDIAVGAGGVWVVGRRANTVTRVDVRTGEQRSINVGRAPRGVAVGEDGVWVANEGDDTITRIDAGSLSTETIRVGDTPRGVAVGSGTVWVANALGNSLTRIDPRSRRRIGRPVEVNANPFALDVRGRHLWVTSPPRGTIQRIDF